MARYSSLLENPRRRRRNPSPRRRKSSRRRKNPFAARRTRRRVGRRLKSLFGRSGRTGGLMGTVSGGVQLYVGRLALKLGIGLADKVEAVAKLSAPVKLLSIGLLLPMVPLRGKLGSFLKTAGALGVASGIASMATDMEKQLFTGIGIGDAPSLGLGDYVTDSGMSEYGLLGTDYASSYGDEGILNDYVTDIG